MLKVISNEILSRRITVYIPLRYIVIHDQARNMRVPYHS